MKRAAFVLLAACGGSSSGPQDAAPSVPVRVAVISAVETRTLDVLFVVDDTANEEFQQALAAAIPNYLEALASLDGTLPDLHVGVASSSVGVGHELANCGLTDDDGALQTCVGATEPYLTAASPSLGDALACNVFLGINGCGFEQPLEAMRLALDGANPGFRRPDAHLQIIVLADEDDCSATDLAVFGPTDSDTLGPLSSFRCFEFGVTCDGADDPRADGVRGECHAREDSYLSGVAPYADFLRGLGDGTQVLVDVIAGDPSPVEVGRDPERPEVPALFESCRSENGIASPAVRLAEFAASFPSRGAFSSICADDDVSFMRDAGARAIEAIATACLAGDLAGSLADLEARCTARDVVGLDTAFESSAPIPRCADDPSPPCFRFEPDARCAFNAAHASLAVDRAAAPPPRTVTVVECAGA